MRGHLAVSERAVGRRERALWGVGRGGTGSGTPISSFGMRLFGMGCKSGNTVPSFTMSAHRLEWDLIPSHRVGGHPMFGEGSMVDGHCGTGPMRSHRLE